MRDRRPFTRRIFEIALGADLASPGRKIAWRVIVALFMVLSVIFLLHLIPEKYAVRLAGYERGVIFLGPPLAFAFWVTPLLMVGAAGVSACLFFARRMLGTTRLALAIAWGCCLIAAWLVFGFLASAAIV